MCRKVLAVLMGVLIIFSVILSGCGGAAETDGEAAEPESEGTVMVYFNDEPQDFSLNSYAVYDSRTDLTSIYGYEEARAALDIYFPGTSTGTFESPTGESRVKYLNRE